MRYVGGKAKIGQAIAREMIIRTPKYTHYVEPFVGAANTLILFRGPRIACDINPYLIEMWKEVQRGWIPPTTVTESDYNFVRLHQDQYPPMAAFVGFGCSFGAKWWGGYARGTNRNYALESSRGIAKKAPYLNEVTFIHGNYLDLDIPKGSLIYCDPPYRNTQQYGDNFDSDQFWGWCDSQDERMFVSEFQAPNNWECVWQKDRAASLDMNTGGKTSTERLFTKKALLPETNAQRD